MADPEDYRLLIEREWADLHHSRLQEWTALGVVAGAHLGLIQISQLAADANIDVPIPTVVATAAVIGAALSILGALMTCRHRQLMKVKLGWIYTAEEKLGLVKTALTPEGVIPENAKMKVSAEWKDLALPRLLSTSGLILSFYAVFLLIDLVIVAWTL